MRAGALGVRLKTPGVPTGREAAMICFGGKIYISETNILTRKHMLV